MFILEHRAKRADRLGAKTKVTNHLRATQVQHAVFQAHLLAKFLVLALGRAAHREGQRRRPC